MLKTLLSTKDITIGPTAIMALMTGVHAQVKDSATNIVSNVISVFLAIFATNIVDIILTSLI